MMMDIQDTLAVLLVVVFVVDALLVIFQFFYFCSSGFHRFAGALDT